MKKILLPLLLIFIFFVVLGHISLTKAQDLERSVTMMNIDGEDIKIWGDDDQACTAIRGKHTECQAIADKCVEQGGCTPQLVTLNFMGCEKCDAVAKPCFDSVEADYKKCIKTAIEKYKEENATSSPADDFSVSVGDGILFLDDYSEALVENPPKEEDLSTEDKAAEINKWIKEVLGPIDESNISVEPPNPQEVMTKPTIVRDPVTDVKRNYYRFSFNTNDPLVYIDAGINRISLTTPNGITFEPRYGDYLRVPFGTKIAVKPSWRDNDYAGFWVSGTAPNSFVSVKSGEVEIVPPAPGLDPRVKTQFKVKDQYTEMRWDLGGGPPIPREIEFEGQPLVKILNKGTDFGISYDPQTKKIAVEIYDGKIMVVVKGEENILASSYGSPIKRMEIEKDGSIKEKTAIPKLEWEKMQASAKPQTETPAAVGKAKVETGGGNSYLLPGLVVFLLLILAGGFWYGNKIGKLNIKELLNKLNKEPKKEEKKSE